MTPRKPSQPTQKQIETALIRSKGFRAVAAKALGVHVATLTNWIDGKGRDDLDLDRLSLILSHEREMRLDTLELVALDMAVKERNAGMVQFLLRTQGKDRGYSTRSELTGADGGPVETHTEGTLEVQVQIKEETLAGAAQILSDLGLLK